MLCYCCLAALYIFWKDCFTILLCCWNLIKIFTLIIIAQVLEIMFSSSELCSCCKCAYFWILMQRQKSNSWFYYIVQWIIDPDFGALMTEKLQYSRLSWVKHALSWMLKSEFGFRDALYLFQTQPSPIEALRSCYNDPNVDNVLPKLNKKDTWKRFVESAMAEFLIVRSMIIDVK